MYEFVIVLTSKRTNKKIRMKTEVGNLFRSLESVKNIIAKTYPNASEISDM